MKAAKKIEAHESDSLAGHFTKKEAGKRISGGLRHIYSNLSPEYKWEPLRSTLKTAEVNSSKARHETIQEVIGALKLSRKRGLREKAEGILEELLTNAIYHAYIKACGDEKYERKNTIQLQEAEKVTVQYCQSKEGLYLSVMDHGGTLRFSEISSAFARCYGSGSVSQIETKASGAGLGLYLVFEAVTHLKFETKAGKWTKVSCWISNAHPSDGETFSFNYLEGE